MNYLREKMKTKTNRKCSLLTFMRISNLLLLHTRASEYSPVTKKTIIFLSETKQLF